MTYDQQILVLLNFLVDKRGYIDFGKASEYLELREIDPELTIEMAIASKYVLSVEDDWGTTLVLTYKGLDMTGRILPEYTVLPR